MSPPQADKAGLHILLKLAALVIILAGIHAAADILGAAAAGAVFRYCSQPAGHRFIRRGVRRPFAITPGGDGYAGDAHRAARRAGGVAQ